MGERIRALVATVALAGTALLTGGTVAFYEESLPSTLNPLFAQSMVDQRAQELVFDRLYFRSTITSQIKSRLVESSERLEGGAKIRLVAKSGVKWHDGKDFTAADICFTVDALLNPKTPSLIGKRYREVIKACEYDKKGNAAIITFTKVFHNPEERLAFRVMPKHKFESTTITPDDSFASRPVGTGPMKGSAGKTGTRFDAFGNAHHGPKIPVLQLAEGNDPIIQVKTLLNGGVQGIVAVAPPRRPTVKASDDVGLKSYDLRSWWYIAVNQSRPHLDNKDVRKALNYAIDREKLREVAMGVKPDDPLPPCQYISGPFIPSSPYYNKGIDPVEVADLGQLDKHMAAAGATKEHDLWIRNGQAINFKIGMNAPLDLEAKDLLIQLGNQLQGAGFQRKVHKVSNQEWTRQVITGQYTDWDLLIGKWSFGVVEDVSPLFHTRTGGKGTWNIFNYSDPKVDQLLTEYDDAKTDTGAQDAYHALHAYLAEDLPYIFLWKLDTKSAWRNEVRGNTVTPYYYFTEFDSWSFSG